jgi:hypothetical protein
MLSCLVVSSIGKGGSGAGGAGGAVELHPWRQQDFIFIIIIPITRACNVFEECGPMISSILRTFLQFNTFLIFIHTYIPSKKLSEF